MKHLFPLELVDLWRPERSQYFFCQFLSCTASNSWMELDLFTAFLPYLWHASRKNLPLWWLNYIMLRSDAGMVGLWTTTISWHFPPLVDKNKVWGDALCIKSLIQKTEGYQLPAIRNSGIFYSVSPASHISRRFGSSSQSRWPRLNSAELVWRVWSCVLGLEFTNGSFL